IFDLLQLGIGGKPTKQPGLILIRLVLGVGGIERGLPVDERDLMAARLVAALYLPAQGRIGAAAFLVRVVRNGREKLQDGLRLLMRFALRPARQESVSQQAGQQQSHHEGHDGNGHDLGSHAPVKGENGHAFSLLDVLLTRVWERESSGKQARISLSITALRAYLLAGYSILLRNTPLKLPACPRRDFYLSRR